MQKIGSCMRKNSCTRKRTRTTSLSLSLNRTATHTRAHANARTHEENVSKHAIGVSKWAESWQPTGVGQSSKNRRQVESPSPPQRGCDGHLMTQVQFNPRYEELIIANEHARLVGHVIRNGLPGGWMGGDEAISAHNESEEKTNQLFFSNSKHAMFSSLIIFRS